MRVHLIKEQTVRRYMLANSASRVALEEWVYKLKLADWNIADDIKSTFATADLLGRGTSRVESHF
jgi:mRNA interferase HigB